MLIYLASYPRSGNTWVRHLISFHFGYLPSSIYPEGQAQPPDLVMGASGTYGRLVYEYTRKVDPDRKHAALVNGISPLMTESFRRQLAEDDECYFLKTHELPYEVYLPGEKVVHIVRHLADVLWSYYEYMQATEPRRDHSPFDVIKGIHHPGLWSAHIQSWLQAARRLGPDSIRISYEALGDESARVLDALVGFLHLNFSPARNRRAIVGRMTRACPSSRAVFAE